MNARLKKLPDGAGSGRNEVVWFETSNIWDDGSKTHRKDFGEIYWPFAVHLVVAAPDYYRVTHLPSGFSVVNTRTKRGARTLVEQLRALKVDWEFTQPSGKKWDAVKVSSLPIIAKYRSREASFVR